MATTSLNELQSYTGDAALGFSGSAPVGVYEFKNTMDAVDRLTAYTVQKKRDEWVQNNKEIHEQAMVAADQFNFSYGDLLPDDKTQVDTAVSELTKWFQDNPTSAKFLVRTDGSTNSKEYNEFINKKRQLDYLIKRGNIRAAQTMAVEKQISTFDDPDEYKFGNEWLNKSKSTPIHQNILLIPASEQFNLSNILSEAVKNAKYKFTAVKVDPNDTFSSTFELTDPNAITLDLLKNRHYAKSAQEQSEVLNSHITELKARLLPQFTKGDGTVDEQGLSDAMTGLMRKDPNLNTFLTAQNVYNTYAQQYNDAVPITGSVDKGKAIKDAKGKVIGFTKQVGRDIRTFYQNGMRSPLQQVNIFDGITPDEYVKMGAADKFGADIITSKVDNTKTDIAKGQLAATNRNIGLDYEVQKMNAITNRGQLDLERKKQEFIEKTYAPKSTKGVSTSTAPATDIYERLQNNQPVTAQELALAMGEEVDPDSREYKYKGSGKVSVDPTTKQVTIDGRIITPGQIQYNLNAQNYRLSSGTKEDPNNIGSSKLYENSLQNTGPKQVKPGVYEIMPGVYSDAEGNHVDINGNKIK